MSDLLPPADRPTEATPPGLPTSAAPATPTSPATPPKAFWREIAETILLTALIYLAVNTTTGRFRIESVSMLPSLQPGQYVLVDKIFFHWNALQRGDIIVFHHPQGDRDLIKRVIGLPGETIAIHDGQVWINDRPIDEPYLAAPPQQGGQWQLGSDQFFMMGDNRNNSSDSRSWGPLERSFIIGRAIVIYWPPTSWGWLPHYTYAATP